MRVLTSSLLLLPLTSVAAQDHGHHHGAFHHSIEQVLALPQNAGVSARAGGEPVARGVSGDGDFTFRVLVTSKSLPAAVFEKSPYDGKRKGTILECAHGGFAYDHRKKRGEVYWFLRGAGILRIHRDRSKIELLETDPRMSKLNMHNATFFEHGGDAMIAWPANGAGTVFITTVDGEVLHTIGTPTVKPYADGAKYAPTDTAYLDGMLWVTDGYGSRFAMAYDLDAREWKQPTLGGRSDKIEPGKFGTNHGITIHKGLIHVADRFFARIHSYELDTSFAGMFPLPEGSMPCDFEFFVADDKLYGVAGALSAPKGSADSGAAIYIVDMETLKVVSTVRPRDDLGLPGWKHLHDVFPTVDDGVVTLFCQAWNRGDFAVLSQTTK